MKKENIVLGTLLLSASSIFVRMIGFVFKVWLSNTMGPEGTGVYSLIMSLYMVCATLATSGISGGVAKLAAKEFATGQVANAKRILSRALMLSLTLSCVVGVLLFVYARQIGVYMLKDVRTVLSLQVLAPSLPFMSVAGCLRGYFIARRKMLNPALSQVVEQLLKMAFIIWIIGKFLPLGIEYGCAVVIAGITLGEVVCFLISWGGYLWEKRQSRPGAKANIRGVTRSLLGFALPVSAGSYVRSGLRLIEDVLILSGLKSFTGRQDVATGTYGILKGMVMPLLIFPLSLLSAFVVTLTPEISRMSGSGDVKKLERTISKVLQFTFIVAIFIVGVLMSFSYQLGMAIYHSEEVGQMLKMLSWLCPFMCVEMVVVSILQGLGEQVSSLRYNVSDCILRVIMVYFLVPKWGVAGFLIMVVISNLYTSVLNLYRLLKITKLPLRLNDWVFKPTLAAAAATQLVQAVCNLYLFQRLPIWLGLCVGIGGIAVVYTLVLFSVGSLAPDDFQWLTRRLRFSQKSAGVLKPSQEAV